MLHQPTSSPLRTSSAHTYHLSFRPSIHPTLTIRRGLTPTTRRKGHNLTTFSDACWGGQFGNAVLDGAPLNSSNSDPSLVLSSAEVAPPLHGNQFDKNKLPKVLAKSKSWPPMNVSKNYYAPNSVQLILICQRPIDALPSTMQPSLC